MPTQEETIVSQTVPGFRANLNLAPQQKDSKLIGVVESDLSHSEPGMEFNADDVLPSDPEDTNGRAADTPDKHAAFTRRVAFFTEYHDSAWIDKVDKTRELEDPTSPIMQSMMAGRWRKVDATIITGALGVAYERPNGYAAAPTAVAFNVDRDGNALNQVVAANYVTRAHQDEIVPDDASDYGLGVGKLIRAKEILADSELEGDNYFVHGPGQLADLLQRTPATSQFYANVKALVAGEVSSFMGFTFIELPRKRLPLVGVNRQCVAFKKSAIVYKGRTITEARIAIRNDKSDTPQAYYKAQHGVSRRYDQGVVRIDCKEA